MVPPNGPSFARSTSTWIHWWSPVASANTFTRSWSIVSQSELPSSSPTAADTSSRVLKTRMPRTYLFDFSGPIDRVWKDRHMTPTRDQIRRAPKVLLHDHLDGGLRPQTIIDLAADCGHALPADDAESLGRWFSESADSGSLVRYLETFDHTVGVMQTA